MVSGFKHIAGFFTACIFMMGMITSCLPDPLEVKNVPQVDQKIVVSSQLIPDTGVFILLTKSIGALDASDDSDPRILLAQIIIEDAEVHIESNGKSYPLSYAGNGVYTTASMDVVAEAEYTLFVNSPTFGSVKATTKVKPLVQFTDITTEMYIAGRDTLANINYSFSDGLEKNWYMINAQHITTENLEDRILDPRVTTKMLDDAEFNGESKSDNFRILFDEVKPGDTISIILSNVNEDYYKYMKLREDTRFGLAAALGEPINYPSNVEGGLGFFNLYVADIRVFTLPE